ncbi:MAG TPA: hypothetical protein VGB18_00240 [Candidatus Thermoplasmatota archaeon]
MRTRLVPFLLAVLLAVSADGALGQASVPAGAVDNTVRIDDAPKDVQFVAGTRAGTPAQNASSLGPQFDHIDILKVVVGEETDTEFKVALHLAALDPPATNTGFPFRLLYFSYGQLDWLIFVGGCRQFGTSDAPAEVAGCLMYRENPAAQPRQVKTIPAEKADGAFVFTINKFDIFNEQRLPAQYGQTLNGIYAYASQTYATTQFLPSADLVGSVSAFDRAPDGGYSKLDYVFSRGSGGHGALGLTSPDPIRVSNGEATTIVYMSKVHNEGDQDLKVQLSAKDVRPDWLIRVPALVHVPAHTSVEFPVVLTMPFSHDHGRTIMFTVRADAIEDPKSFAELKLGVWWTDVPQPSAHHNGEMWFHSAPADFGEFPEAAATVAPFKQYWFNSIEDDPNPLADDGDAPAFFNDYFFCPFSGGSPTPDPANCKTPPNFTSSWFFPLSPSLLIGLDFDLAKTGLLLSTVRASMPATQATMEVELRYCDPEAGATRGQGGFNRNATACSNYQTILATGSLTRAITAQQASLFEVPLTVEPTADYLPFKRGANIGLRVKLVTDVPQNLFLTEPRPAFQIKSSQLFLPLIEFHDTLADEYLELGAVRVTPLDPYEKKVNPGRTTLFRFEVENNDDAVQHLRLDLEGVNAAWAVVAGVRELTLDVRQKSNFTVAVVAPADAVDEERAELVVVAQSLDEPAVSGIGRMRATIVSGEDIPDESGMIQAAAKTDTPAPGLAAAVFAAFGALLFVVWRRRNEI